MRSSQSSSFGKLLVVSLSLIGTLGVFQNCSPQFKLDQIPSELVSASSFSSPAIEFNSYPALIKVANQSISFKLVLPADVVISTVVCQLNTQAAVDCSSRAVNLTNLIDGDHSLKVTATTDKGVAVENRATFRKDSVAPTLQVSQTPASVTALQTATFTFMVSDSLSGTGSIKCALDGAATFTNCTSPYSVSNLAEGNHTLKIQAQDLAGNSAAEYSYTWNVNLKVPSVLLGAKPTSYSNTLTAQFTFTGQNSVSFQCQLDTAAYAACTSPMNYSALSVMAHTFRVRALDSLGAMSAAVEYTWTVDNVVPSTPNITSSASSYSNVKTATMNFSSTDSSGLLRYECSLDTAAYATCTSPVALSALGEGAHAFKVRAVDNATNVSAVATFSFTVDTVAPTLTLTQTPLPSSENNSPQMAFTSTDSGSGVGTIQCSLNGAAFSNCTSPKAFASLTLNVYTATVRVQDLAGNSATAQTGFNVLSLEGGKTLYTTNCASCHQALASSTKANATSARISTALQTVSSMAAFKSLNAAQVESIALALVTVTTGPIVSQFQCDAAQKDVAPASPLLRLTSYQHTNTLKSVFDKPYDGTNTLYKDAAGALSTYPQDALSKSGSVFDGTFSATLVKAQFDIADYISTQAAASSAKAVTLGLTSACFTTPTETCIKTFITSFGRLMLRKVLSTTEINSFYTQYYSQGSTNTEKLKGLVLGLMMDPEHLMLFEVGNDTPVSGVIALTNFEIATRLSYRILNDTPDDTLLTAAAGASFLTDAVLQTQIDRMIASTKFTDNMDRFLTFWLQVNPKSGYPADLPSTYFNDTVLADATKRLENSAQLRRDAADYFVGILRSQMNYKDLITANVAFPTTSTAAKVYGLSASQTTGVKVTVPHRGLMQRPGFLLNANGNSNPIYRGKFMLTSVLCREIGSPADFNEVAGAPNLDPVFNSTRKVIEAKTSGSACIGCHSQFNHFGFALEAYDGLGRSRLSENFFNKTAIFNYRATCNPANTSIAGYNNPLSDNYCPNIKPPYNHALDLNVAPVLDLNRAPASVTGPVDFADALSGSLAASGCMSTNLYRFMNLKKEATENNCELNDTQVKAHDSSQAMKNVLFDKFKQPWFRSRKVVQ